MKTLLLRARLSALLGAALLFFTPQLHAAPTGLAVFGNAVEFDGVNDFVHAAIPVPLMNNYTISAWVFIASASPGFEPAAAVLSGDCGATTELMVRTVGTNHLIELGRCNNFSGILSTNGMPLQEWVHLAVTVSTGKQVAYFINGLAAGTWNAGDLDVTINPTLRLGDNISRKFNGRLDDVRIWKKALTRAQVVSAMNNGAPAANQIVMHYTFDEVCGDVVANSAPLVNPQHGLLVNGAARLTPSPAATPPVATTLAATHIGATIATLNGRFSAGKTPARAWFEYGTTTNYGGTAQVDFILGGNQARASRVAGLAPGTTHHFRAVTASCLGTNYGANRTFVTPAGVPRTNILVTTLADSGPGSLRDAVLEAGANSGPHTNLIQFAANLAGKTIRLTSGEIFLESNFSIDASALPGGIRIDGNGSGRIFFVDETTVLLDSLTLTNGTANDGPGGAIFIEEEAIVIVNRCLFAGNSAESGGAIYNAEDAVLILNQCTFSGNTADYGGGILNGESAQLTLNDCTLSDNLAFEEGGGIYTDYDSTLILNQCTLTANAALDDGGGIYAYEEASVRLNHSTLTRNNSENDGGGIYVEEDADVEIFNCIVADNVADDDGHNIQGDYDTEGNNFIGSNARLAQLGNYGGPTQTMPPLLMSPVIDAGDIETEFTTDQRGFPRFVGGAPDLGAVESTLPCLRAYYSFDNLTAVDKTGNSTATYDGDCGARWEADHSGRADSAMWNSLDCRNRYLIRTAVTGNANRDLGLQGSFTVSAWIYPTDTSGDRWVLGNTGGGGGGTLHLGLRDSRAFLGFGDNDLGGQRIIPTREWTHLAFTYNLQGGIMSIYVNGELDATALGRPNNLGNHDLLIGWLEAAGDGSYFDGRIDDLAIYCQALAPNQIAALAANGVKPDEILPSPDLPLPAPNGCVWSVREIYAHPAGPFELATAEYVAHTAGLGTFIDYTNDVINFTDPQTNPDGDGFIRGERPYRSDNLTPSGVAGGDDNDFVLVARTTLVITEEDDYTFGFSTDDGARLRIKGAFFKSSTRLNDGNPADPAHRGDTLVFPDNTGDSATLGVAHLLPGAYEIEFLTWEVGGGAHCEVFYARGSWADFNEEFRLLGYAGSSTLVATVTPFVQFITNGAAPRTVQFTVQAGGFGANSYQWFFNGSEADAGNVSGANSATLTISDATGANAGSYSVRVENNLGSVVSGPGLLVLRDTGAPDKSKPSLTVTAPKKESVRVLSNTVALAGTIRDNRPLTARGPLTNILAPGDPIVLVNGVNDGDFSSGPPPLQEGVEHAIDRLGQKYLNFLDLGSGFAVTPALGPTVVSAARFYTANDSEARDPASYVVEGSTSGTGGPWTVISSGTLSLPLGRNPGGSTPLDPAVHFNQIIHFHNPVAYTSYRVIFPTLKDAEVANSMQIGEVELLGVLPPFTNHAGVYVSTGNGPYLPALGAPDWSLTLPLAPGANVFRIIAVDEAGNISKPVTREVFYAISSPLTVTSTTGGKVSPNLDGKELELGCTYSMRAIAAKGYVFSNWTGGVLCSGPLIKFPMSPGLALQANFVPNPFAARAGSYNGLFHETAAVRHDRSGFFTGKVTDSGGFSGYVKIDGKRLPVSGRFDLGGNATNLLKRTGTNALRLELQFDPNGPPQILGRLTDGEWIANLIADLAPSVPRGRTVPLAGKYTFALQTDQFFSEAPAGLSVGAISVGRDSRASILTKLADGTTASQSVPMPTNGPLPFYLDLYKGKGSALGWLYLARTTGAVSAVFGHVNWFRPAITNGGLFAAGFDIGLGAFGSVYLPPASNRRVLPYTNATASFALSPGFDEPIKLGTKGAVTDLGTNALKMSFTTANGLFSGTATDPVSRRRITFGGVALQGYEQGVGWLLTTNASGMMSLGRAFSLIHEYRLNGTLADEFGGPSLVSSNGNLGPSGYDFTPGHDLSLSGALTNTGHYSIEMLFSIDDADGYRRFIDFKNFASDEGLYSLHGVLVFYNFVNGALPSVSAGQLMHLVLTRDSATSRVTGYVNGVQQLTFIDDGEAGVFSGPGGIMHFLRDDAGEDPSGFLDYIRIYDAPVSSFKVEALYVATEP